MRPYRMSIAVQIILLGAVVLLFATTAGAQRSRGERGERNRNGAGPTTSSSSAESDPYRQHYAVIYDHNIFLRDRRPRNQDRNAGPRAPSDPDASFVITGVLFEDEQFTAYIEDVRAGRLLRLHAGDAVSQGHIVGIEIDAVAYERGGTVRWVDVGSSLSGGAVSSVSDARVNAALTTGAPGEGAAPIDPNAANLSLEERMRLRRLQELGGPAVLVPPAPESQPGQDQPPADANRQPTQENPPQVEPESSQPQGNLSLEEQMRLRREQELNGGR